MNFDELSRLNDAVNGKEPEGIDTGENLDNSARAERKLETLRDILLSAAPCAGEPESLGLADRMMARIVKPVPKAKPISVLWKSSLRLMSAAALIMVLFALHYNSALQAIDKYYSDGLRQSELQTIARAILISPSWNEGNYPEETGSSLLLKIYNRNGVKLFSERNPNAIGYEATPIPINKLLERNFLPAQIPIVWEKPEAPGVSVEVAFLDGRIHRMTDAEIARLLFVLRARALVRN